MMGMIPQVCGCPRVMTGGKKSCVIILYLASAAYKRATQTQAHPEAFLCVGIDCWLESDTSNGASFLEDFPVFF